MLNPSPLAGEGEAHRASDGRVRGGEKPPFAPSIVEGHSPEAKASAVSLGNNSRTDLTFGQRIFHGSVAGYGPIAVIEANKLEIDFEQAGRKRVLDSFVSVG